MQAAQKLPFRVARLQGRTVTHAAEHAGPSNEEKSIVPVSVSQLPHPFHEYLTSGQCCGNVERT